MLVSLKIFSYVNRKRVAHEVYNNENAKFKLIPQRKRKRERQIHYYNILITTQEVLYVHMKWNTENPEPVSVTIMQRRYRK